MPPIADGATGTGGGGSCACNLSATPSHATIPAAIFQRLAMVLSLRQRSGEPAPERGSVLPARRAYGYPNNIGGKCGILDSFGRNGKPDPACRRPLPLSARRRRTAAPKTSG